LDYRRVAPEVHHDPKGPNFDHIEWAPPYRITHAAAQPLQPGATVSGELHDDKTQIYFILAGSGTIQLGGKPTSTTRRALVSTAAVRWSARRRTTSRKATVISIPPLTWHASYADPGQTMNYLMVHIENRQTIHERALQNDARGPQRA